MVRIVLAVVIAATIGSNCFVIMWNTKTKALAREARRLFSSGRIEEGDAIYRAASRRGVRLPWRPWRVERS